MRAWLSVASGLVVLVCARGAAAQSSTFGVGFGGLGTALMRNVALDARLAAAGRNGVGGPAGGFSLSPIDVSIGPARLALAIDGAFPGNDATRSVHAFTGALQIGARIRHGSWVLLPSIGPSFTELSLCLKGPPGAVPVTTGPLFDQILSAAGSGECLRAETPGMRFEVGVDREWVSPPDDNFHPSFFIGARAGVTLPLGGGWKWGKLDIDGPTPPMVTPYLGIVVGFRVRGGG